MFLVILIFFLRMAKYHEMEPWRGEREVSLTKNFTLQSYPLLNYTLQITARK